MSQKPINASESETELSFEKSFKRLEDILERMNASDVTLDESLDLFTEANQLINECGKKLNDAERRVEVLIKSRNGELVMEGNGKPATAPFEPASFLK